ncbi:MAG: chromate transporter [Clostridia bacterium]|nr:chromate transporter [Clostridia bacterium]
MNIFLKLFLTFFKIGAFTFGGGYAMLPFIQEEVAKNNWLSEEVLMNFIAVSESTPGPFAINMATFIGASQGGEYGALGGLFGAFCATLGVVLPSFIIILIVAKCYARFQSSQTVKGIMSGLKPAVIGLIASAVISAGATVFATPNFTWSTFISPAFLVSLGIFGLMLFLALKKKHPILLITLSACVGIGAGYLFHLPV